jgi:cytoskeleton protein RodZ
VVASSSGTLTDDGISSETTDTSPNAMVQPATGQDTLTPRATTPFPQPEVPEQTEASTTTGVDLLPTAGQDQSEGQDTGALSAATATDTESGPESDPESNSATIDPQATPEVVATFSGPCWVDIRDAAGQVLLFGEMAAGDRRVLDGDPPYSLVVGNASATELTVGGRAFDLRAIAKGNVARFKLDPAEFDPAEGEPTTNGD